MSSIHALANSNSDALTRSAAPLHVFVWPIDPQNPYTVSLYAEMGRDVRVAEFSVLNLRHRHDIWHVHWPEALLNIRNPTLASAKLTAFLAMIDWVSLRGGKIVWTVHNLKAHDELHPRLEVMFYRRFIRRVDGVISLSETALKMALEKFGQLRILPTAIIRHGHYRNQYAQCPPDARSSLGIDSDTRVILFFGEIRGYKNVDVLVRAFRGVQNERAHLLIAGRPKHDALGAAIAKEGARDSRVRLELAYIDPALVGKYFGAADLVVLPYRHILNSGAALLALSFNRPVLVPDLGAMSELTVDFGDDWIRTFSGEIDAAKLESALEWAGRRRPLECPMPQEYLWETIRSQTLSFYRQVMSTR
ncbi:glycosyltransferase family 4 protein [Alloacidobacterium dinghuense]|uniref:Glycosyltransferase family 4 protein n=1 Tax=Alloacidobacterium dinghuense TaxID=2763107 RepID=A0A7G8BKJ8_9BACT|nr:glycosyltransferase family 4 protein [Alloacidobacterium dinghuense]QNI33068.1 glycosyltransferase family 4 protein [Alloacidobacterium dinghuense]